MTFKQPKRNASIPKQSKFTLKIRFIGLGLSWKSYKIKVIVSNKNLGFAGGNNLAIEQAKGKYLL